MRLTVEMIRDIARTIHDDGFKFSEAYPIRLWKKNGWPEDKIVFEMVDLELRLLRLFAQYEL